jgi:hypothetical protein
MRDKGANATESGLVKGSRVPFLGAALPFSHRPLSKWRCAPGEKVSAQKGHPTPSPADP